MFESLPTHAPATPLLDSLTRPSHLKQLTLSQLQQLATEVRAWLLYSVNQTGGHFGAGLGVVELTIALHRVFNTPQDRLVWDVGHQAYPHKILTGRKEELLTIRQKGGLAPFPKREESPYDTFGVGHSSTSISAALGMALASQAKGETRKAVAIIGDGAMTAGMAFEALTHAGHLQPNLLVILNDNEMSISHNTGGLANYLSKLLLSDPYKQLKHTSRKLLSKLPLALDLANKTEEQLKGLIAPSSMFEQLGFSYTGPLDGHNLEELVNCLEQLKNQPGAQFLHIKTTKGKGFLPAELDPIGYHALSRASSQPKSAKQQEEQQKLDTPTYSQVFGRWLCHQAATDVRLQAITPAMCEGSGMVEFARKFPQQYFDVAIAEQHAVTLAAGMACEGLKPVVAIYSTFLQRGYDQLVHDVALQDLDVLFAVDRAGLVGEDGPTHHGTLDLSFLNCVPNLVIMSPANEAEAVQMLTTGYEYQGPAVVRYPRGKGSGVQLPQQLADLQPASLAIGKGELLRQGKTSFPLVQDAASFALPSREDYSNAPKSLAILALGSLVETAKPIAEALNASLINLRFVKPLDKELILQTAQQHTHLVTLEENALIGGVGSSINQLLLQHSYKGELLNLGLPDAWVEHGSTEELLAGCGLNTEEISKSITKFYI